jgi:hypothetical protein
MWHLHRNINPLVSWKGSPSFKHTNGLGTKNNLVRNINGAKDNYPFAVEAQGYALQC